MHEALKHVLQKFNDGYVGRKVDDLDAFMEELFIDSATTVILGTSDGELCLGIEQAKNLIKNDWLYWNDFRVDPEEAIFHPAGNAYWFGVVASIKYAFKTDDATHERLLGFVRDQLELAEKSPLEALSTLNWGLAHYLFPREEEERTYHWPVRLTGVLCQDQGKWKFQYMQFCLPSAAAPDQRHGTPYLDHLYKGPSLSSEGFEQSPLHTELVDQVSQFCGQVSVGDTDAAAACFAPEGLGLLITPQDVRIEPGMLLEKLTTLRTSLGALTPNLDNALTFTQGELAWVVCDGMAHKTIDAEAALRQQMMELHQMVDSDLSASEKMLQTQLRIVRTLRDIASGSEYSIPFRLEVAMSREGNAWWMQAVQISHAFYWIFEDKIPAARV